MRKGERPVVKASVEMEEQMVKLEGRLARVSLVRTAISWTDSSGPGGTTPMPVSMAGIAKAMELGAKRRIQQIIIQALVFLSLLFFFSLSKLYKRTISTTLTVLGPREQYLLSS